MHPAHLIELAEEDAKKATSWVRGTIKSISQISKTFNRGKKYSELIGEAQTQGIKLAPAGHFSDTRFATYSSEVLKGFLKNYTSYYARLNADKNADLDLMNNARFVLGVAAMADVYKDIGLWSQGVQKVELAPWDIASIIKRKMEKIENLGHVRKT